MALPIPAFYTTTGGALASHDFGSVQAGAYKPAGSTGWEFRLYNAYGSTTSDTMTSVKVSVRDDDGGVDEIWVEQHWIQIKSSSGSTGSGIVDDAQTIFTPVGKNKELSVGDIPSGEYRTLYARCYPPTDAEEDASIEFQLRVTCQQPATPICNWITGLRGDGVVASTGDPLAMSTGTTGAIPYEAGYALVYNNEIYFGSSGSFNCSTGSSGTNSVYLTESGSFGMTTGTTVAVNQLKLYEAVMDSSGNCTALTDKRVYLAGLQSGTTGAMPSTPGKTGDLYLGTNGKLYGGLTSTGWTVIVAGATFVALTDTPTSYSTGDAKKLVRVTTGEDAVEFVTDFSDYADGAMVITGGMISKGTSGGTFKVAALTAALRETTGDTDKLIYKTLAEQDNQTITAADTTYFITLAYSTGTPTISISATPPNENNVISIGKVRKTTGDDVHFLSAGRRLQDGVGELHKRSGTLRFLELANGCTVSYAGTNNMDIITGIVYGGINRFTPFSTGTFHSSGTDTFTYVGQSTGSPSWHYTTGQSVIDFAHYDDGTTGLDSITVGQYGCHWVYLHPSDVDVYIVYGRDSYKLAEAEVALEPNVPDLIGNFGLLLGKIVAPQAGGSFTTVDMVTDTVFSGTSVATHNSLGGLDVGDYQHMTATENAGLNAGEQTIATATGTVNISWATTGSRNAYFLRSTGSDGAVEFNFTNPPNISADLQLVIKGNSIGSTGAVTFSTGQTFYWAGAPAFSTAANIINKVDIYYSTGLTAYLCTCSADYGVL